ncbi:hypothetical protein F5141DRAFT_1005498 [Pisolithus sp. B1]|nr:hypothetical protein F5141DRAFT_1005498 [Pisolithus sp. B1]
MWSYSSVSPLLPAHLSRRTTPDRVPSAVGDFISRKVYDGKLKTCHANSVSLLCCIVDVRRGQEKQSGKSWVNHAEVRVVVQIAGVYQVKGVTLVSSHHTMPNALSQVEQKLQAANLEHDDSIQYLNVVLGNEAKHIIISVVRSDKLGFLANQRPTNVMLSRCKMAVVICKSQAFAQGPAASTLIGQLATALGPEAWVCEDVQRIMARHIVPPHPTLA